VTREEAEALLAAAEAHCGHLVIRPRISAKTGRALIRLAREQMARADAAERLGRSLLATLHKVEAERDAREQRATAAEAEVARLRALLGPVQEAARLFFDLEAARARIQNLRARGCDGQADDAEEACADMHDRMRVAFATLAEPEGNAGK
jgi:hypothetical protein